MLAAAQMRIERENRLQQPFDAVDPVIDDQVDMEINVALDELLGLRGPISSLLRNLLWLLVFNTIYLGFFAFIPKTIGSSLYSAIFNTTTFGQIINALDFGTNYYYLHSNETFHNQTITTNTIINTTINATSAPPTTDNITITFTTTPSGGIISFLRDTISAINQESDRYNAAFRLPDFATINLGYFSMAFIVILVRLTWILSQKIRFLGGRPPTTNNDTDNNQNNNNINNNNLHWQRQHQDDEFDNDQIDHDHHNNVNNQHDRLEGQRGQPQIHVFDDQDMHPLVGDGFDFAPFSVTEGVTLILDATVAVVKVGVLLFLKMFLLPVLLGLWLDGSTMPLFGFTVRDRILYAGRDLFSFILLHWVAGITFMLLVTVSVLQLREVTHPDLLAHLIRPQEPQPDLLGNLMHDSVVTQTKRMMLSLAIYTVLLNMHVSLPVKLLLSSGITNYMPFLRVKLWHIVMPQLQIPLELLIFHLSMLALLEKYKNSIGEMQHHWLKFMCHNMGLTDYLLPQSVHTFRLIGTIPVFASDAGDDNKDKTQFGGVNPFWYDLLDKVNNNSKDNTVEDMVLSNLKTTITDLPIYDSGSTKLSGERVLTSSQAFIRLPPRNHGSLSAITSSTSTSSSSSSDEQKDLIDGSLQLLPTKIGCFRFKRRDHANHHDDEDSSTLQQQPVVIEVWKEVTGRPIARPPEGWDDLGAGGADVQGRWAWGKEKKSTIEGGVAERVHFFRPGQQSRLTSFLILTKVLFLLISSWFVTTLLLFVVVAFPLALGRFIYCILRVQERFIHYPLGFAVGSCIVFPSVALGAAVMMSSGEATLWQRLGLWLSKFHCPPKQKLGVVLATSFLWSGFCPLVLGLIYELMLVKTSKWFAGEEALVSHYFVDVCFCWTVGFVLLNGWACLCSLSVFTRDFWINIGNGMLDAPLNDDPNNNNGAAADDNEDDNDDDEDHDENAAENNQQQQQQRQPRRRRQQQQRNVQPPRWQGRDGRIARFFAIWKRIILRWEWEAVDSVLLLQECALPVAKQLTIPLAFSSICYAFWLFVVSSIFGWDKEYDKYRIFAFRIFCAVTLTVQLCIAFESQIRTWFRAAHKTARDDKYLIGEILLNYDPDKES